jgi:hypothetical protein
MRIPGVLVAAGLIAAGKVDVILEAVPASRSKGFR